MELWWMDVVGGVKIKDTRDCSVVTAERAHDHGARRARGKPGIADHSRFCVAAKVVARAIARPVCEAPTLPAGRRAEDFDPILSAAFVPAPEHLRRSLTWDRGREMAEHGRFSGALACPSTSATLAVRGSAALVRSSTAPVGNTSA
jgi:hypothetical protein